jgi:hypothetical protein
MQVGRNGPPHPLQYALEAPDRLDLTAAQAGGIDELQLFVHPTQILPG